MRPIDDTTALEFDYWAKPGALATSLNWLMTNHPDVYFYGALEQAYLFVKDYDQAANWVAKKMAAYDSIKKVQFRDDGALAIRIMGNTP